MGGREIEPIRAGVGVSKTSPEEALDEALDFGGLEEVDAILCAFSPRHDPSDVREALLEQTDPEGTLLLGFSSAGNITTDGYSDGTVAVLAMELSSLVTLGLGVGSGLSEDPYEVSRKAVSESVANFSYDVSATLAPIATGIVRGEVKEVVQQSMVDLMLFVDGLCAFRHPEAPMDVLRAVLDDLRGVPKVVGAMTGDDLRLERTYVFDNRGVYEDAVAALTVYSSLKTGCGIAHGYEPMSGVMLAESEGTEVMKLDGRPALDVYSEVVGEEPDRQTLLKYPLGIFDFGPKPYYLIRTRNRRGGQDVAHDIENAGVNRRQDHGAGELGGVDPDVDKQGPRGRRLARGAGSRPGVQLRGSTSGDRHGRGCRHLEGPAGRGRTSVRVQLLRRVRSYTLRETRPAQPDGGRVRDR